MRTPRARFESSLRFRLYTVLRARVRNGPVAAFRHSARGLELSPFHWCQPGNFNAERDYGGDIGGEVFQPLVLSWIKAWPVAGSINDRLGPFFRLDVQQANARLSRLVDPRCCLATICSTWYPRRNASCGKRQCSQRLRARCRTSSPGPLMPAAVTFGGP